MDTLVDLFVCYWFKLIIIILIIIITIIIIALLVHPIKMGLPIPITIIY